MSCTVPEVSADAVFFFLIMNIGSGSVQCQLISGVWTVTASTLPGIEYRTITDDDCNLLMNDNTLTVNFNITEGLRGKEITCRVVPSDTFSDSILNIQQLKCKCFYLLYMNQ